jgi:hypothetical protein
MKHMTFEEQMAYTADAEKAQADELARAWFEYYSGRSESEEEFAQMRNLMLNKSVDAQEAALALHMGLKEKEVQNIMQTSEEETDILLSAYGITEEAALTSADVITEAQMQAAQNRNNAWMDATHELTANQTAAAEEISGVWGRMFSSIWESISSIPGDVWNYLTGGGGGGGADMPAQGEQHAEGGALGEGLNIVGERGPEAIIKSGSEARVITAQNTPTMGGGVTINMNASIASDMDVDRVAQRLGKMLEQRMTGIGYGLKGSRI